MNILRTDIRLIHALLVLVILFPLFRPLGLPLTITKPVKDAYDLVESLPKGSIVLHANDVAPSNEAENWCQLLAMVKHNVSKGHRIILVSTVAEGPMYSDRIRREVAEPAGYLYGKDIVVLPYRAGGETAVTALAEDFQGTYKADYYGTPSSQLPLMQEVKGMKDIAMIGCWTSGDLGLWYIRQVEAKYKTPTVTGIVAVGLTLYGPFQASGQLKGLLLGQAGAAEYETLIKSPGKGLAAMDAQATGHLYMILLIVIGNIFYFRAKRQSAAAAGKGAR
jgi:hypothetical protein